MKKIRKLYIRNFLTSALIMLLSFTILGAAFTMISYRYVINERMDSIKANAREVAMMVTVGSRQNDIYSLDMCALLSGLSKLSGSNIFVCDEEGMIISSSDIATDQIGRYVSMDYLESASEHGGYSGITSLGSLFAERRYVIGTSAEYYYARSYYTGYVFLTTDTRSMASMWNSFSGILVFLIAVILVITFIISIITTKKQAKPINEMANASRRFARGDFDVRITDTNRRDEIGALTEAFNIMADSLERSENQRRELIANVSHELKTPMTTITGFADGILDGTIPPERQDDYLRTISSEAKRLARLVRNMLDMSHIQDVDLITLNTSSFDASEVLRLAIVSLEPRITQRGLDVEANLPEEPVMVLGSMDSITQVVYNLLDNAIKFAHGGTAIRLELWKQGTKAYVSIEDTGDTIPEDELPLIFDRFHKTDKSRSEDKEGVGLGLYIVRTILDQHGNDIFVTSKDNVTRFVFSLNLAQEKTPI